MTGSMNNKLTDPAKARPRRVPHVTFVEAKAGPRRFRARLQVDGKRREAWGLDETEAIERWIKEWRQSLITPASSSPSDRSAERKARPKSTGEFLDRFRDDYVQLHLGPSTQVRYERDLRKLREALGHLPFPTPRDDCQAHINDLIRADAFTTTIAKHAARLSKAYNWAARDHAEWEAGNPARLLNRPAPVKGVRASQAHEVVHAPVIVPSRDEVRRILEVTAEDEELGAFWYAMANFGPRPGECLALMRDAIRAGSSTKAEYLHIVQTIQRLNRAIVVGPTKGRKNRKCWLPPADPTLLVLLDQAERMALLEAEHPEWDPRWTGYLFRRLEDGHTKRSRAGDPILPDTIKSRFDAALKKAGIDKAYTPHHLRHYHVSEMLRGGFSVPEVAQWTGQTEEVIQSTYTHVLDEIERPERHADVLRSMNLPKPRIGVRSATTGVHEVGSDGRAA